MQLYNENKLHKSNDDFIKPSPRYKRKTVLFDRDGPSGNIYYVIGLARNVLQMQGRITDFNIMRDRVFNSKSYEDALKIINEYVKLIDAKRGAIDE